MHSLGKEVFLHLRSLVKITRGSCVNFDQFFDKSALISCRVLCVLIESTVFSLVLSHIISKLASRLPN